MSGEVAEPSGVLDLLPATRLIEFRAELVNGAVRVDTPLYEGFGPADEIEWLWPHRVPRGMVTLIEGTEGVGKSFVVLDLAARVSRGMGWPDSPVANRTGAGRELKGDAGYLSREPRPSGSGPGTDRPSITDETLPDGRGSGAVSVLPQASGRDVLMICRPDEFRAAARRLTGLGADLARIRRLKEFSTFDAEQNRQGDRPAAFPYDLPAIEHELRSGSLGLVVIDSLADFCAQPAHVAESLRRLNELAEQFRVAIVVTLPAHCRFDGQGKLRVTSRWRTDGARCVWCLVADPEDPARRLFVARRTNFHEEPEGLEFRLQSGRVAWDVDSSLDPSDPLGRHVAIDACLAEILHDGFRPAEVVYRLGGQCGFTPKQLRAAAARVGIESLKAEGFGIDGGWVWWTAAQRARAFGQLAERESRNVTAHVVCSASEPRPDDPRLPFEPPRNAPSPGEIKAQLENLPASLAAGLAYDPETATSGPVLRRLSDLPGNAKNEESLEKQGESRRPAHPGRPHTTIAHTTTPHITTPHATTTHTTTTPQPGRPHDNAGHLPVAAAAPTEPVMGSKSDLPGNAKNEESLEKMGESLQPLNPPQPGLPRDRYARQQERKRRQQQQRTSR